MDTLLGPRGAGAGAAGPGWPVTDESPRSSSAWKDTTQDFAGLARICLEIRIVNCQRAMGYMAVREIGYRYIHPDIHLYIMRPHRAHTCITLMN